MHAMSDHSDLESLYGNVQYTCASAATFDFVESQADLHGFHAIHLIQKLRLSESDTCFHNFHTAEAETVGAAAHPTSSDRTLGFFLHL